MNDSFESLDLEDYTLDAEICLLDYVITEVNNGKMKGYIKDT